MLTSLAVTPLKTIKTFLDIVTANLNVDTTKACHVYLHFDEEMNLSQTDEKRRKKERNIKKEMQ